MNRLHLLVIISVFQLLAACAAMPLVPVAAGAAGAVMIDKGMEQQYGDDGLF